MSITGISTASSAAYIAQGQATTTAATLGVTAQTPAVTPTAPAQQAAPTQQSGQVHHHHGHHGGGGSSREFSDVTQSGTSAATNILNTLV